MDLDFYKIITVCVLETMQSRTYPEYDFRFPVQLGNNIYKYSYRGKCLNDENHFRAHTVEVNS